MGEDKADLRLGGRTLLEIAVAKLLPLCDEVVLVGTRPSAPAGLRVLPDLHPGCGPMGGIEAALADLSRPDREPLPDWALLLPVDMPFIPAGLLQELLYEWSELAAHGLRVALIEADGRLQPLVSLLHRGLLPAVWRSLAAGDHKVRPLLEAAPRQPGSSPRSLHLTTLITEEMRSGRGSWVPGSAEWRARSLWFCNLNTPADFAEAEGFADALDVSAQVPGAEGGEGPSGVPQPGVGE